MNDRFIGKVVNVLDPERAGRVQIRVFGDHDDSTNVPDADLPWARCVFPVTHALYGGVSGPTTGLVPGSTIVGRWVDRDHQIPIVEGTLGRAVELDGQRSSFPRANVGDDVNDVLNINLIKNSADSLKNNNKPTIGNILYDGQSIMSMLSSGSIFNELSKGLSEFNSLKSSIQSSDLSQVVNLLNSHGISSSLDSSVDASSLMLSTGEVTLNTTPDVQAQADASGVVFNTASFSSGNISDRLSKQPIKSVSEALNRVNGSKFVMNNVMPKLDSMISQLKQTANRKQDHV